MTTSSTSAEAEGATRADRVVRFIQTYLRHTTGKWAGSPFILAPWQRDDIIVPLFGTVSQDEDGEWLRQYRTAYVEIPRKNGKSELAAAIALYLLFSDHEQGAEVYGAAKDKDQAAIIFRVAAEMVRRSPKLRERSKIIDSQKRIVIEKTNSFYRAIPADAAGSHGFNAHAIIFDELHTQPNRELWDVLTTSSGARSQPLTFAITTAGYDKNSICYEQHDYAERLLRGAIDDPSFFAYIRKAADDADWKDEAVWRACNPALDDGAGGVGFRNIDEMRALCRRAAEVPALQNTFRRLYLNQWTAQEERWLDLAAWDACDKPVEEEALAGRKCYGGLDLASTTDIAALALVFPPLAEGDDYRTLMRFFIPGDALIERERRDRVPYSQWVREGWITATEGNVIHYSVIRAEIDKLAVEYDIEEMAFDRWGATQMTQELDEAGMTVVPIGQGFASLSPPTKELLNIVLDRKLRHGANPVLRWMADNVVVETDPAGNLKPSKKKSTQKIDGIVALIMALDRATRMTDTSSVYERRGLITL